MKISDSYGLGSSLCQDPIREHKHKHKLLNKNHIHWIRYLQAHIYNISFSHKGILKTQSVSRQSAGWVRYVGQGKRQCSPMPCGHSHQPGDIINSPDPRVGVSTPKLLGPGHASAPSLPNALSQAQPTFHTHRPRENRGPSPQEIAKSSKSSKSLL